MRGHINPSVLTATIAEHLDVYEEQVTVRALEALDLLYRHEGIVDFLLRMEDEGVVLSPEQQVVPVPTAPPGYELARRRFAWPTRPLYQKTLRYELPL
jgi:CRISPR/Cas system-associated protein Csm6